MKQVKSEDLRLLHRLADGETVDLVPGQLAAFERRIAAEPVLGEALEQLRSLRAMFAPSRSAPGPAVPDGFAAGVLLAVRQQAFSAAGTRMPGTEGADRTVSVCRRLLLLAAAIAAVAVLLHTWVLTSREPKHLQAAPTEVQREMDRLDNLISADKTVERR
jgi:hypothetical protein